MSSLPPGSAEPPPRRRFPWARLAASLLAALALVLIIAGFMQGKTGDQAITITDPTIEYVFPRPGDLVLRQSPVEVDLQAGWDGALVVDGIRLPPDQIQRDPGQNKLTFTPREGAEIEQFAPGDHTVSVLYWKVGESEDAAKTFFWRFRVS